MIIVFGSNILDQFMPVENMPEADQAIHIHTHIEAPGGKGQNQAVAASRAGAPVRFYGAVGKGGHGRAMIRNLQKNKIATDGIHVVTQPTGMAVICVNPSDGTHRIIVSQGANSEAKQSTIPDSDLGPDTVLLLQAELALSETEALMARARTRGCKKIILNLAPYKDLSETMLRAVDILVMNEHEANALAKHQRISYKNFEDLAQIIHTRFGVTPIITLGPKGAICFDGSTMHLVACLPVQPVDTVGAGDAFCGYLAALLNQGDALPEALRYACAAGSLTCTRIGAQSALPKLSDVKKALAAAERLAA